MHRREKGLGCLYTYFMISRSFQVVVENNVISWRDVE